MLIVGAVLCALMLSAALVSNVESSAFRARALGNYGNSDSAGVATFSVPAGGADTLSILQLNALNFHGGAVTEYNKGTDYFHPAAFTAVGSADTLFWVIFLPAKPVSAPAWQSDTDSLGLTIQRSPNGTNWFSDTEILFDPDGHFADTPVTGSPFPFYRIIVKWNDNSTGKGARGGTQDDTIPMTGYILHKE